MKTGFPRGTCRFDDYVGRKADKRARYVISCGCCGRSYGCEIDASLDVHGHRGIKRVRNIMKRRGWIFTAPWGWVCREIECQSPDVTESWAESRGETWRWHQYESVRRPQEGALA